MTHAIVTAARGWLGTRFHHQGRVRRSATHAGGVDCLGLLVGVARELDLRNRQGIPLASFDETDYPHQPDGIRLRRRLAELLAAVPASEIQPGDILLLNIDNHPQHLAIVSFDNAMIHAYAQARAVVEHPIDGWWRAAITASYRI